LVDVTLYVTSGGMGTPIPNVKVHNVDELLCPGMQHDHDVLKAVSGNSHFHLPFIELLSRHECVVIAHDTRMVEYYTSLRDRGGATQVMLRSNDPRAPHALVPELDDQIDDMRLLKNAGMWEIAQRAEALILHSRCAAARIEMETGVTPIVLPFANQRVPDVDVNDVVVRDAARSRLGFEPRVIHLASFGLVDSRTKMSNVVVEAAAWLTQWGHSVALHMVGGASEADIELLTTQASSAGLHSFSVTGFVPDAEFRDYLLAIDIGIQLRVSPLLGVSGPLSDVAAFGTPAVASSGLAIDVDAPEYVYRLPDQVSAVTVAEAIEGALENPIDPNELAVARDRDLSGKTPTLYAERLLGVLENIVRERS